MLSLKSCDVVYLAIFFRIIDFLLDLFDNLMLRIIYTANKSKAQSKSRLFVSITSLIEGKKLLLIDDSIVRGTQLGETTQFLYDSGAKEVHIRTGCPPILYSCKYLNFTRSTSEMELMSRKAIAELEGREPDDEMIAGYVDPDSDNYKKWWKKSEKN